MRQQTSRVLTATGMAAGLLATGVGTAVAANGNGANANAAEHVTICHATGTPDDAGNGYVEISPAKSGVIHGHAAWDFKAHERSDNGHEADIIPAFTYTAKGDTHQFPGQNLDDGGQAFLDSGCEAPEEETPGEETPGEETPGEETPGEETPGEETPGGETPGEETPAGETPDEEAPAGETPDEEAPAGETPAADAPAEQPAAEEAVIPQTPAVVQTDGFATGGNSLLTALGVVALLGGGAAAVTVGVRTAARRD